MNVSKTSKFKYYQVLYEAKHKKSLENIPEFNEESGNKMAYANGKNRVHECKTATPNDPGLVF